MIDLDKARAARSERQPKELRFAGKTFELPAVFPLDAAFAFAHDDSEAYLRALLGDQFDAFMALRPDREDLLFMVTQMAKEYAVDEGESLASSRSSRRNGTRSRPTSNGSTGSRSVRRAGA